MNSGETGATQEAKDEFSIEVIHQWERTLNKAQTPATRKIALRTTMVFGEDRTVFSRDATAREIRSGRQMGSGGNMCRGFTRMIFSGD